MAVDVAKLRDEYNAKAALCADTLSAFNARMPLVVVGSTITDFRGIDWKYTDIIPTTTNVAVYGRYIDPVDGETDYISNLNFVILQKAMYPFNDTFTITDASPGVAELVYVRPDLAFGTQGEILTTSIDGAPPLNPATEFEFDSETGEVTFLIALAAGQIASIDYKKAPYNVDYP